MPISKPLGALVLAALLPVIALAESPRSSAPAVASTTSAGPPSGGAKCKVTARSQNLALVLCPTGLGREALQSAGEEACKMRVRCNAWIWDDPARLPAAAPATDAELPKESTGHAVAVWVQDSKRLMSVRRVKN